MLDSLPRIDCFNATDADITPALNDPCRFFSRKRSRTKQQPPNLTLST